MVTIYVKRGHLVPTPKSNRIQYDTSVANIDISFHFPKGDTKLLPQVCKKLLNYFWTVCNSIMHMLNIVATQVTTDAYKREEK